MNIIDYAILAFAALSALMGVYRGSVCTGLNVLGAGLSLLIARIAYPYMTEWIAGMRCGWNTWCISPKALRTSPRR